MTTSPPSRPLPLELEAQPVTPSSWPTQAAGPAWPAAEAAPTPSPSGSRRSQQPPPHHKGKPGAASAPAPSPAPSRRPCRLMRAACPFSARKPRITVHSAWSPSWHAISTPDAARSGAFPPIVEPPPSSSSSQCAAPLLLPPSRRHLVLAAL